MNCCDEQKSNSVDLRIRDMIELCARCGKPTPYSVETPITLRRYFVEGAGQLCPQCFRKLYGEDEPFLSLYERGCGRLLTKDEDCPK